MTLISKWFQNLRLGSRVRRKPMKKRSPASGGMSKYILKRFATQLLGLRWGFETTSNQIGNIIIKKCKTFLVTSPQHMTWPGSH
jgi:hypothetical protein